ncbi:2'-5' RNA ligase family protein [Streptococcus panodentis]|uniref:2'-5' RNA ligase family protein n=1 Tax=Streptococcus panodentis TaxID=1581472 RepID=A0ABS5AVR2_9STRE|nr:2'-5' RNA ligase family protein [Streptococcus panodentis]MBP2620650.1 hypothetical protein [Streptococcus panodentis]
MYAIIATLDKFSQEQVRLIWHKLSINNLSNYAYEVDNREPHLTLASLERMELPAIQLILNKLAKQYSVLDLNFSSISSFLGSSIVTLNPVKTPKMTAFHAELHGEIEVYVSEFSPYLPNNWVPHVTLANRIEYKKLSQVYLFCLEHCPPITGTITGLKLIEVGNDGQVEELYEASLL